MMNGILGQALTVVRTSAQGACWNQGYEYTDEQGRTFEYCQFLQATIKGSPVAYKLTGTKRCVTNVYGASFAFAVAGVCIPSGGAALSWGWVQKDGLGYVNLRVTGTVADRTLLAFTETGKASGALTTGARMNAFAMSLAAKSGTNVVAGKYQISAGVFK